MGKVILTERQYKNLKRNLISKTINESNNQKKRILNEVGYFNNWIDVDFVNLTLTLNKYLEFERSGGGSELKLNAGVVFKRTGGVNSQLVAKNTAFQLVGDYTGGVEESGKGTVTYYCATKNLDIAGRSALFFPEDLAPETKQGFLDLCNQKPAAAPVTTVTAPKTNLNWGGSGTDPERYWNGLFEKLKPYGAKLSDGTATSGPFMYWGKFIVYKNYSYNNGCIVIDAGNNESYKFTGYDGKYAGQTLDKIVLTPCIGKGAPIDMKTLIGTKTSGTKTSGTEEKKDKKVYVNPKSTPKSTPKSNPVNTGGGGERPNIAAPTGYEQSLK